MMGGNATPYGNALKVIERRPVHTGSLNGKDLVTNHYDYFK
jgi:hypothetical protein